MNQFIKFFRSRPVKSLFVAGGILCVLGALWLLSRTGGQCGPLVFGLYTIPRLAMIMGAALAAIFALWFGFSRSEAQARRMAGNLLVAGLGLAIPLGVISLAMRFTDPPLLPSPRVNHPIAGVWHAPNKTHIVASLNGEYRVFWQTDGQGIPIRDGLNVPQEDAIRILILGDSMMQGDYVPMDQTMSVVLRQEMEADLGVEVQTINLGLQVTSPLNYLMTYRAFQEQFDPQIVIAALYVGNDFTEDARLYHSERVLYENGQPIAVKPYIEGNTIWTPFAPTPYDLDALRDPLIETETWQQGPLRVAQMLACQRANISQESWFRPTPLQEVQPAEFNSGEDLPCRDTSGALTAYCFNYAIRNESLIRNNGAAIYADRYPPEDLADIELTLSYLVLLARDVEANGQTFVLMIVPHAGEIEGQMTGSLGAAGIEQDTLIDGSGIHQRIDALCRENDLTCLDLLPVFQAHSEEQLTLRSDPHLAPDGNRVAAEAAADLLEDLLRR